MSKQHSYLCELLRGQGLGPCCHCMRDEQSANLLLLNYDAPIPGTGWGCAQCGLPDDGALAVMCDECMEAEREVRYVCVGRPGAGARTPVESLTAAFHHRLEHHPERFRFRGGLNGNAARRCAFPDRVNKGRRNS
jgi:hypothetical protein